MAVLNEVAKQARITAYKDAVLNHLGSKVIDTSKPEFADLFADRNPKKLMSSLNGEIILERDLREDGSLKGVVSVSPEALAAMLPDLKVDTEDKAGWGKYLEGWLAEGLGDILEGVSDPDPSEYELSAMEELATLDIDAMSTFEAKQKLIELKTKLAQEIGR